MDAEGRPDGDAARDGYLSHIHPGTVPAGGRQPHDLLQILRQPVRTAGGYGKGPAGFPVGYDPGTRGPSGKDYRDRLRIPGEPPGVRAADHQQQRGSPVPAAAVLPGGPEGNRDETVQRPAGRGAAGIPDRLCDLRGLPDYQPVGEQGTEGAPGLVQPDFLFRDDFVQRMHVFHAVGAGELRLQGGDVEDMRL